MISSMKITIINRLYKLKEKLFNGPPGPPGSIEYIRWRESRGGYNDAR